MLSSWLAMVGSQNPERWLSGRKRQPAKLLHGLNCVEGSNPSLSATNIKEKNWLNLYRNVCPAPHLSR